MNKKTKKEIAEYFTNQPVEVVYLFGSHAKGRAGPMSDFDIGVLMSSKIQEEKYLDYRLQYISDIFSIVKTDKLDLILINNINPELKFNVIKPRSIIYMKDKKAKVIFETRAMHEYYDRQYYIKLRTSRGIKSLKKRYDVD